MTSNEEDVLEIINYIFLVVYTIECTLKITGLGLKPYFHEQLKQIRFHDRVPGSLALTGVQLVIFNASTLRYLRIIRVIKAIKMLKGVQRLILTLITTIPSLINVGATILLLYFVYAIAGMSLFGSLRHGDFYKRTR